MQKHSTITLVKNLFVNNNILCKERLTFADLTTIGCGGHIELVVYPKTIKELSFVWQTVNSSNLPCVVLGRGSNVLASDKNYDGVVIVTTLMKEVALTSDGLYAQCGCMTVMLSKLLAKYQCGGGEFLYCLPATIGGATVMNAGCFGQDMSQILNQVQCIDKKGRLVHLSASQCKFGYRSSLFKHNDNFLVVSVLLKMIPATYDVLARAKEMFDTKRRTQPLSEKSFGSAFYCKGVAVSKLIDLANLKGATIGGAMVSHKHAGFVINNNHAKTQDILLLLTHIRNTIKQKYCYDLDTEVCLVGEQWRDKFNDLGRLSYTHSQQ